MPLTAERVATLSVMIACFAPVSACMVCDTVDSTSASSTSSASQMDASNSLDASLRPRSTSER